ncbi:DNA mismatch repair endonuclease MutL [Ferruginibacter paludis]|uniref:DNA mismatch repair endonuclease MutL n=1 Tax=Ferruginibacter paludis TaxID=1310417 RepID=UPI0025B5F674|nr:DNA mismatch repair endonuclease MutL [Ferruginibacter paludis]MDN3658322.1 DNA mismatch repair endonuclease MutL [Ferruginibacter paludis]
MPDIIQLLPDNIANQIAAGEVIQRPASAVKELLENAVDAGATEIKLIVNDAGKALIQVIDNGKGMSETDARMSFERHATSKIKNIDDLFHIKTMGFRGEALASIAAVSQVELKSKKAEDITGTCIEIDNSVVKKQEPVAMQQGTSIAMKNLFFNVPARRNFLKSNPSELRHIVDEFIRVSMAFPAIFFSLTSNGQQVFHLESGTLKQRIVQILGNSYNAKLVSVQEQSDYMNIYGFVGKPETAKKTRGDQYFFVNSRFIKSAYLNHAVMGAFDEMIAKDSFPMYTLFIDLDPAQIDINVHPTKQEIKFEDEKIVYAFVKSAVKHALAQFSITPTLDFELDSSIQHLDAVTKPFTDERKSSAASSSLYNTFTQKNQAHFIENKSELKHWKDLYEPAKGESGILNASIESEIVEPIINRDPGFVSLQSFISQPAMSLEYLTQLHNTYIVVQNDAGFMVIHQQNAHERILYERFIKAVEGKPIAIQQNLFPITMELTAMDVVIVTELLPELHLLGYHLEPFGNNTFVIQGTPADVDQGNEKTAIEKMLEQFKHFSADLKYSKREKLFRSLAWQQAVKGGTSLTQKEMKILVEDLFACTAPNITPNGKPTYTSFKKNELDKMFGR